MAKRDYMKEFVEGHQHIEISPAKVEYTLFKAPEFQRYAAAFLDDSVSQEDDAKTAGLIAAADSAEELVNLMRKAMSSGNRSDMREKLLVYDKDLYPLVQEKVLTSSQDLFIENAANYLMRCEEDPCEWIMKEYENVNSDYMKSMLCLVLGIRGCDDAIPLLIKETYRFEEEFPDEMFEQGPFIAVQELAGLIQRNY